MRLVLGLHDLQLGRAIRAGIDEQGRLQVVGAASTPEGLVETTDLVRPDVILVDETLVHTTEASLEALRAASDDAAVIVLLDAGSVRRSPFPSGATAYLELRPVHELIRALTDIARIAVELGVVDRSDARSV
jgi:DNA-binding NarL/FixJ family response regulator